MSFLGGLLSAATGMVKNLFTGGGTPKEQPKQNTQAGGQNAKPQSQQAHQQRQFSQGTLNTDAYLKQHQKEIEAAYKAEREAEIKRQQDAEKARIEEQKKKYMEQKHELNTSGVNRFFADAMEGFKTMGSVARIGFNKLTKDEEEAKKLTEDLRKRVTEHTNYWDQVTSNDAGASFENWAGRKIDHLGNKIARGAEHIFNPWSMSEKNTKEHEAITKAIDEKWNQKDTEEAQNKIEKLDRRTAIQNEYVEKYKDLLDQKSPRNIEAAQKIIQEEIRKANEYDDLLDKIKAEHDYVGNKEEFEARYQDIKEKRFNYVKNHIAPLVFEGYGIDEAVDILSDRDPEFRKFRMDSDVFESDHDWAMAEQAGGKFWETVLSSEESAGGKIFKGAYHLVNVVGSGLSYAVNRGVADNLHYNLGDGKGFDNLSRAAIYNQNAGVLGRTWQDAKNIVGGVTTEIVPELAAVLIGDKGISSVGRAGVGAAGMGISTLGQNSNKIASIIDKTNKITNTMQSSRVGSTLIRFGDEMLTDTLLYDPLINGAMGIQYSEEQFKSDLGANLIFNPLIAMFSRGGTSLADATNKFDLGRISTPEGNLKLTEHEIDLINKGKTDLAEVSILNRANKETQYQYTGNNKSIHPKFQKEIDTKTFNPDSAVGKAVPELKKNVTELLDRVRKGENSAQDTNKVFAAQNPNLYRNGILDFDELKQIDDDIENSLTATNLVSDQLLSKINSSARIKFNQAKLQEGIRSGAIDIESALKKQADKYPEKAEAVNLFRAAFGINPNPAYKFTGSKSSPNLMRNKLSALMNDIFVEEVIKPRKYQPYQRLSPRHIVNNAGEIKNIETGLFEDVDSVVRSLSTKSESFFSKTMEKGLTPVEKISNPTLKEWFQNRMNPNTVRGDLPKFLKHRDPNKIPASQADDLLSSLIDNIEKDIIKKGKEVTTDAVRRHDVFKAFKKNSDGTYNIDIKNLDKKKVLKEIQEKIRLEDNGEGLFKYIADIRQQDRIISSIKEDGLKKTIEDATSSHPNFVKQAWNGFTKVMSRKTVKSVYNIESPSRKTMNMIINQFNRLYQSTPIVYGKLPDGVKGATSFRDGKIIIDPEKATITTPLHEYAHVWVQSARHMNIKEYDFLKEKIKTTDYYENVKKEYGDIYKTEDELIDEAIVHAIEDAGKKFYSIEERVSFIQSVKKFFIAILDAFKKLIGKGEQKQIDLMIKNITDSIANDIIQDGQIINSGLKMQEMDMLNFSPDDLERTAYFVQQVANKITEDKIFLDFMKSAEGNESREQVVFHMIDGIVNGKRFKNESMNQLADTLFEQYKILGKYIDGDLITKEFVENNMNRIMPHNTYYSLINNFKNMEKNNNAKLLETMGINQDLFKKIYAKLKDNGVEVKEFDSLIKPENGYKNTVERRAHQSLSLMVKALASNFDTKRFFLKGSISKDNGVNKILKEIETIKNLPINDHEKHESLISFSKRTSETLFGQLFENLAKNGVDAIDETVFNYTTNGNGIQTTSFNKLFALLQAVQTPKFVSFKGTTEDFMETVDTDKVFQFTYPKKNVKPMEQNFNKKILVSADEELSLPKTGGNTYIVVDESLPNKAGYKFTPPENTRVKFITIDDYLNDESIKNTPENVVVFSEKFFNENSILDKYSGIIQEVADSKELRNLLGKSATTVLDKPTTATLQFSKINVVKTGDQYSVDIHSTADFLKEMEKRNIQLNPNAFAEKDSMTFFDHDNRSVISEESKDNPLANAITDAVTKKEQTSNLLDDSESSRKRSSQIKRTLTTLGIDQSNNVEASMGDMLAAVSGISADASLLTRALLSATKNKSDLAKIASFDNILIGKSLFYWYAQALKYDEAIANKSPLNLQQPLLKKLAEGEYKQLSEDEIFEIENLEGDITLLKQYLEADVNTRKSMLESVEEIFDIIGFGEVRPEFIDPAIQTISKKIESIKNPVKDELDSEVLASLDPSVTEINSEDINIFIEKLIDSGVESEVITQKLIGIIKADPNKMKNIILESNAFEYLPKMDHFIANNLIHTIAKNTEVDMSKIEEYLDKVVSNNNAINISRNKDNFAVRRFIGILKSMGIIGNYPTNIILKNLSDSTKDSISQTALSFLHKDIISSLSSDKVDDYIASLVKQMEREFGKGDNINTNGFKVVDISITSGKVNEVTESSSKNAIEDANDPEQGAYGESGVDGMFDFGPEQALKIRQELGKAAIEMNKNSVRSMSPSSYNFDMLPPTKEFDKENELNLLFKTMDQRTTYTFKGDFKNKSQEETKQYLASRTQRKNSLDKRNTETPEAYFSQELERKILAVSDRKNFSQKAAIVDFNTMEIMETMDFEDMSSFENYLSEKKIQIAIGDKFYETPGEAIPDMLNKYEEAISSKDQVNIISFVGPNGFTKNYTTANFHESPIFKQLILSSEKVLKDIEVNNSVFTFDPNLEMNLDNIQNSLSSLLNEQYKKSLDLQKERIQEAYKVLNNASNFSHREVMYAFSEITDIIKKNLSFKYHLEQIKNLSIENFEKDLSSAQRYIAGGKDRYPTSPQSVRNIVSGAAEGSDTIWAQIGKEYGIQTKNFTADTAKKLSPEKRDEYMAFIKKQYQEKYGRALPKKEFTINLQLRNLEIADNSNQIISIDTIVKPGFKGVDTPISTEVQINGGSKIAIDRAISQEKPVFVYNRDSNSGYPIGWHYYDYHKKDYIKMDNPPVLKINPGLIGTRTLSQEDIVEMNKVFENSFNGSSKDHMPKEYTSQNAIDLANALQGHGNPISIINRYAYKADSSIIGFKGTREYFNTLDKLEDQKLFKVDPENPSQSLEDAIQTIENSGMYDHFKNDIIKRLQATGGHKYALAREFNSLNAILDPKNYYISNTYGSVVKKNPHDFKTIVIEITDNELLRMGRPLNKNFKQHPGEKKNIKITDKYEKPDSKGVDNFKYIESKLDKQFARAAEKGLPIKIIKNDDITKKHFQQIVNKIKGLNYQLDPNQKDMLVFVPKNFLLQRKFYNDNKDMLTLSSKMRKIRRAIHSSYLEKSGLEELSSYSKNTFKDPFSGTFNLNTESDFINTAYLESLTRYLQEEKIIGDEIVAVDFFNRDDLIKRSTKDRLDLDATKEDFENAESVNDSYYVDAMSTINLSDLEVTDFAFKDLSKEDYYFKFDEFGNKVEITIEDPLYLEDDFIEGVKQNIGKTQKEIIEQADDTMFCILNS